MGSNALRVPFMPGGGNPQRRKMHMAVVVKTNGIPFWLVGEFTHFRFHFSGWIGMFTGGTIWLLTHGHIYSATPRGEVFFLGREAPAGGVARLPGVHGHRLREAFGALGAQLTWVVQLAGSTFETILHLCP